MLRTTINVTGDAAVSISSGQSINKMSDHLDRGRFSGSPEKANYLIEEVP